MFLSTLRVFLSRTVLFAGRIFYTFSSFLHGERCKRHLTLHMGTQMSGGITQRVPYQELNRSKPMVVSLMPASKLFTAD